MPLSERSRDLCTLLRGGIVADAAYQKLDTNAWITGGNEQGSDQSGTFHGAA